jgi:hypothetical protein
VSLGIVGHPGAVLGAVLQAASGRIKNDKREKRRAWMKELSAAEDAANREADAAVPLRQHADPSVPGGL